jgi:polysaccharide biosynthesis protein PslA
MGQNTVEVTNVRQSNFARETQKYFPTLAFSETIISGLLALTDSLIILLSGLLLYLVYPGWDGADNSLYMTVLLINTVLTVFVFYSARLYSMNLLLSIEQTIRKVLTVYPVIFLVLIAIFFATNHSSDFSRIWIFAWFLASALLISLSRLAVYLVVREWSKAGRLTRNIAIVGSEKQAVRLVKLLNEHAEPWIRIVGIFDERASRVPATVGGYPLLGNLDNLINFARNKRIDDVLVALPGVAEQRTLDILKKLNVAPIRVRLCPDMVGFNFLHHGYSFYGGIPVLNIFNKPIEGWDRVAKEIEDRVLGLIAFVLLLPVMIVIAILVKLDSRGPIFFSQQRYGFNNKMISVLKFRTMYTDNLDINAEQLVTRGDPRVTRLGAILRRTSLDELPQIINVLKGEMSIVGPRPHAKRAKAGGRYYHDVVAQYAVRHKVKPGITGWAQVNGWRGETDTEEKIIKRIEYDLDYINRWSLMFDMRILFKTIMIVLSSKNAY